MQKELKPHSNSGRLPLLRRCMHPPMAECHVINCAVGHQFAITHDVFSWYIKYLSRHCKIWHASTTLGQRNTPIVGSRRQSPLVIITRLYTCTYMDPQRILFITWRTKPLYLSQRWVLSSCLPIDSLLFLQWFMLTFYTLEMLLLDLVHRQILSNKITTVYEETHGKGKPIELDRGLIFMSAPL